MGDGDTGEADAPGPFGRLMARLQGEIPADVIESYRRAGSDVYELIGDLETRRAQIVLDGDAWSTDAATQSALVAGWCAFSLQVLGDALLDADYETHPGSVGYVPPVTADQALRFYGQVLGWLARARRAQANPSYRLDVVLPARLPQWVQVDPCPRAHLAALRAGLGLLRRHALAGLADFQVDLADDRRQVRPSRRCGGGSAGGSCTRSCSSPTTSRPGTWPGAGTFAAS